MKSPLILKSDSDILKYDMLFVVIGKLEKKGFSTDVFSSNRIVVKQKNDKERYPENIFVVALDGKGNEITPEELGLPTNRNKYLRRLGISDDDVSSDDCGSILLSLVNSEWEVLKRVGIQYLEFCISSYLDGTLSISDTVKKALNFHRDKILKYAVACVGCDDINELMLYGVSNELV